MYALLTYFCRAGALETDPAGLRITLSDKKKDYSDKINI